MFHAQAGDPAFDPKKFNVRRTKLFYMPPEALAVAPCYGQVVKVARDKSGVMVKLAATSAMFVPDTCFLFLHLQWACVVKGQDVSAGDAVGAIGDDPRNPRDPMHLHFGQRQGEYGPYVDPTDWLEDARHVQLTVRK
jgi:murein DD-endopeptidase MepM/ murein hydrolase activator NlpD